MCAGLRKLVLGKSMEQACPAFKGFLKRVHRNLHMDTRAYVAVSCLGDMTMLHIGYIGLEDPG